MRVGEHRLNAVDGGDAGIYPDDMGSIIGVVAVVGFIVAAVAWRWRDGRRRGTSGHDDLRRAGDADRVSPEDAARRAEGSTAWTRLSGP